MKTLLLSTALVAALGGAALAQTAATGPFYATQDATAVRASDLIGARIYAAEAALDSTDVAGVQDGWQDIGEVNDVILSRQGNVEAVLVDIGGFLGMGERQVAVAMTSLRFANDSSTADTPDDWFLVMQADRAMLEGAPAWESSMTDGAMTDGAMTGDTATNDTTTAPAATEGVAGSREGYTAVAATDITSDMLDGATVMDRQDASVGTVSNLVIGADGKITDVIVDVGGFLGLGSKPVALKLDQLEILRQTDGDDLRIYVGATKEELEAMPAAEI